MLTTLDLYHGQFLLERPVTPGDEVAIVNGVNLETDSPVFGVIRFLTRRPPRVLLVTDNRDEAAWCAIRARGLSAITRLRMTPAQRDELTALLPTQNAGENDVAYTSRLLAAADPWFQKTFGQSILSLTDQYGHASTLAGHLNGTVN